MENSQIFGNQEAYFQITPSQRGNEKKKTCFELNENEKNVSKFERSS